MMMMTMMDAVQMEVTVLKRRLFSLINLCDLRCLKILFKK
jgi:hypothetical protein